MQRVSSSSVDTGTTAKSRSSHKLTVNFNQPLVDWINKTYPERNWFMCNGVMSIRVGDGLFDLKQEHTFTTVPYPMQLKQDASLFFDNGYIENDLPLYNRHNLITEMCEFIIGHTQSKDIYLAKLHGYMSYIDNNRVETEWILHGYIDNET